MGNDTHHLFTIAQWGTQEEGAADRETASPHRPPARMVLADSETLSTLPCESSRFLPRGGCVQRDLKTEPFPSPLDCPDSNSNRGPLYLLRSTQTTYMAVRPAPITLHPLDWTKGLP